MLYRKLAVYQGNFEEFLTKHLLRTELEKLVYTKIHSKRGCKMDYIFDLLCYMSFNSGLIIGYLILKHSRNKK